MASNLARLFRIRLNGEPLPDAMRARVLEVLAEQRQAHADLEMRMQGDPVDTREARRKAAAWKQSLDYAVEAVLTEHVLERVAAGEVFSRFSIAEEPAPGSF